MKKMFKKLFVFLFAITCLFAIVGCGGSNDSSKCPGCNVEGVTHDKCETCGEYVCVGDHKHDDKKYTSETYSWETPQTDNLKLTESYAGKDFIKDGIGEVSRVVRYVDGDTTVFQLTSGEQITVRYNGINTPESTYRVEPWGFAASAYNKNLYKNALENGAKIVLQTESLTERLDSTGTRYLAWIWLVYPDGDSRLVNLEMAEKGYGQVKNAGQYAKYFNDAIYDISVKYGLRIYGEKDPKYDYSTDAKEMTINELRAQYGTKEAINEANANGGITSPLIKVSGLVVRKNGNKNAYIQQYDQETNTYYGIYVYGGYNAISKLMLGSYVQVTGRVGTYYGSLQLTDVTSDSKIRLLSAPDVTQIVAIPKTIDEIDDIYNYMEIGNLVTIQNLKVTGYKDSDNNSSFTVYCKYTTASGQEKKFNIRVDSLVNLVDSEGNQIQSGSYFEGKTIASITGIVNYYNGATSAPDNNYENGHIQLGLTSLSDVTFAD